MNRVQKENFVERIVTLLDETLLDESEESETKPLTISKGSSKATIRGNHVADIFWFDFINICEEYNLDFKNEWVRIRKRLSTRCRILVDKNKIESKSFTNN